MTHADGHVTFSMESLTLDPLSELRDLNPKLTEHQWPMLNTICLSFPMVMSVLDAHCEHLLYKRYFSKFRWCAAGQILLPAAVSEVDGHEPTVCCTTCGLATSNPDAAPQLPNMGDTECKKKFYRTALMRGAVQIEIVTGIRSWSGRSRD